MKLEKAVRISWIISFTLFIGTCVASLVCLMVYGGNDMSELLQSVGGQIVIGFVSGLILSLLTSIITAFLLLRKIPDRTKEQISHLFSERLGYESTNHKAIIEALNPNTKTLAAEFSEKYHLLADEHKELRQTTSQTLEHLRIEKVVREEREKYLTGEQKSIDKHVEALRSFADIMAKQQVQISQLQERIHSLEQQNTILREQLELTQEQGEDFEMKMH